MKLFAIVIGLLIYTKPANLLIGRWQGRSASSKESVTSFVFKDDNRMEVFVNRKAFASGAYFFSPADSILSFTDNACDRSAAIYKINFFSNSDSLRFSVIYDTCTDRKRGIQLLVLGRAKL